MKILLTSQVKEADKLTIANEPVSSIRLMERASLSFTRWFLKKFNSSNPVVVFAGSGNNGGDALAIARLLIERQYTVRVYLIQTAESLSDDCAINLNRLRNCISPEMINPSDIQILPKIYHDDIIIDGIFGSGLNRPVEGGIAELIRYINNSPGKIVSVDIPSGLFGEDNLKNIPLNIIRANNTVTFEFPFLSFFMSENEVYTGIWEVIPIGLHKESIDKLNSQYSTIDTLRIRGLLIPRKKYSHKGTYGHALIIAGRQGMMGAAVLCARACLRGGSGLTTVCIPDSGCDIIQGSVPEALTKSGGNGNVISELPDITPYQAIAFGPAVGTSAETEKTMFELIRKSSVPLVLDADALTILSEHKEWLNRLPVGSVITPHPKEFDRLAGISEDMYSRHMKQLEFASQYKLIVVLKGANTIITTPDGNSFINTTGNPGMATGGTGDVLTGLIVSLIAQGYTALDASLIAVYLHGLAGDIFIKTSGMEALIASDLIDNIGEAFHQIRKA